MKEIWGDEFVSKIVFSNYYSFDSSSDVINPNLDQKGPNWYFMYQCWKVLWSELFIYETVLSTFGSFDLKWWCLITSNQITPYLHPKLVQKGAKLVSHKLMMTEKWKPKGKGSFRWDICLWNYLQKFLKY